MGPRIALLGFSIECNRVAPDLGGVYCVAKSRGHFRGGCDEFFRHQDIVEVDAPGLTSPILSRFAWRHMPRPVLPIDDVVPWTATWTPPA